jgi:hypothetical protein
VMFFTACSASGSGRESFLVQGVSNYRWW